MILIQVFKAWVQGRSGKWPIVRREYLRQHPICAACGGKEKLEAHHVMPFNLDSQQELNPGNLITLCRKRGRDCHFHFGHLLNFQSWNPSVREDAQQFCQKVRSRP